MKFLVIDSNSIIHRAFHALPPLTDKEGILVNAVYGFFSVLIRMERETSPDSVIATFDLPGPTFRHKKYEKYKETRPPTPSDLIGQFSIIKEGLIQLKIPIVEEEGFEADDLIGSVVNRVSSEGIGSSMILTGDRDNLQLIDSKTEVILLKRGIKDLEIYSEEKFREEYQGLNPDQLIEIKALQGDSSDNIPGVAGIGEKTAMKLILDFNDLEGVYNAIDRIPKGIADKLIKGKEVAFLSRELATIKKDIPLRISPRDCLWQGFDNAVDFFEKKGFSSLLKRLEKKNLSLFD